MTAISAATTIAAVAAQWQPKRDYVTVFTVLRFRCCICFCLLAVITLLHGYFYVLLSFVRDRSGQQRLFGSLGCQAGQLNGRLVGRSVGRLVAGALGRSFTWPNNGCKTIKII